ncbi:hypothetical protein ACH5RR_020980 [Cinchona calisaya]|uniref:GATA-type domain-containing protein n=1 Tax=Cinchona calisaya TaxID=153742 RepID=A0ABD2ZG00_9GENT
MMMRWRNFDFQLALILVLLLYVSNKIKALPTEDGFNQCEHILKKWASSSVDSEVKEDKHILRDLLYFLHVPRTGGRTYYHCFLKKLYSNSLECPRSYDRLRFNPRKTDCRLLVTHDDYSVMSKLPKEKISVVTILRNPIDRVFSTYEFSVEVAARFLLHPNLTSALRMSGRLRASTRAKGVSTLDIWPWKYLVPWMREDLFARREARRREGRSSIYGDDPYDMGDVVMPLHEYINDPIAQEIIHNGATFQIAGLTNNSYLAESHEVRHCVQKYPTLGEHVLQVAKKRLDDMLYIGLTENHRESATIFANVVGAQVISQFAGSNSRTDLVANNNPGQSSLIHDTNSGSSYHMRNSTYQKPGKFSLTDTGEAMNENMTTGKLMEVYESCISSLRSSQSQRRTNSLKNIRPANFTKEARGRISKVLLEEITSLNHLDVELYKYAQGIFGMQQGHAVPIIVAEKKSMVEPGFWDCFVKGVPGGEDDFSDLLGILDFPMESLEGDDEWDASKSQSLGPIPSEALMGLPPVPQGNIFLDDAPKPNALGGQTVNQKQIPDYVKESSSTITTNQSTFSEGQESGSFQAHSPISVLESGGSCSGGKSLPIKPEIVIPVRTRSKRARASVFNPWFVMTPISYAASASKKTSSYRKNKEKKKKLSQLSVALNSSDDSFQRAKEEFSHASHVTEKNETSLQRSVATKKCTHCEVTKTPQWREGPMGPKTLCNACGVRYRSGRLFPEYRPVASPSFVPTLHSNSHRKVVEMRKKVMQETLSVEDAPMSPAPELVPNYLFDFIY